MSDEAVARREALGPGDRVRAFVEGAWHRGTLEARGPWQAASGAYLPDGRARVLLDSLDAVTVSTWPVVELVAEDVPLALLPSVPDGGADDMTDLLTALRRSVEAAGGAPLVGSDDETAPPDLPDPTGDVVAEARQVCALLDDPLVGDPGPRFVIQLGLLREALAALDAAAAR